MAARCCRFLAGAAAGGRADAAAAGTAAVGLAGMGHSRHAVAAGAAVVTADAAAEARCAGVHCALMRSIDAAHQQVCCTLRPIACAAPLMQRSEEHGGAEEGRQRQRGGRGGRGEGKPRAAAPKMAQAKRLFTNKAALVRNTPPHLSGSWHFLAS